MLTIPYYRGWLSQYKQSEIIKNLINEVENADIIIASIADNRMFDLISEFIDGSIINKQCEHALATTNLEKECVIKTSKALNKLKFVELFFLANNKKEIFMKSILNIKLSNKDSYFCESFYYLFNDYQ